MDIRNIIIIYDGGQFTYEGIVKDLQDENYKHNFLFANKVPFGELPKYLEQCDEVWTFGAVEEKVLYRMAKNLGKDIWKMG